MLPTTYPGAATVAGEHIRAELELHSDHIRLAIGGDQEILRWPIRSLDVAPTKGGGYRLRHGAESFTFEPSVDDGLGDEISLRRRFSDLVPTDLEPTPPPPVSETIADRIASNGRGLHRSQSVLSGRDLPMRTVLLVLGVLALVIVVVATVTGSFDSRPATVIVAADGSVLESPQPFPDDVVAPATNVEAIPEAPVTTVAEAAPAVPPSVAAATVTTPPPTTVPPTTTTMAPPPPVGSAFELTPAELASSWDSLARPLSPALMVSGLSSGDGSFSFGAGDFVRLEGSTTEDIVDQIVVLGDPSGTVADDRQVLTALGIAVALVEPDLPPEGRRELLSGLGLDVESPNLAGLDGAFEYREKDYRLRWDGNRARIVFEVSPAPAG